MPTCTKCGQDFPAATSHPCSFDLKPEVQKQDQEKPRTYEGRQGKDGWPA